MIRAAQLDCQLLVLKARRSLVGCLRVGCIPSKALLESSHKFVEAKESFSSHGIKVSQVELDLKTMMKRKTKVVNTLTTGIAHLFKKNGVDRYEGLGSFVDANTVLVSGKEESTKITGDKILIATGSSVASKRREVDG